MYTHWNCILRTGCCNINNMKTTQTKNSTSSELPFSVMKMGCECANYRKRDDRNGIIFLWFQAAAVAAAAVVITINRAVTLQPLCRSTSTFMFHHQSKKKLSNTVTFQCNKLKNTTKSSSSKVNQNFAHKFLVWLYWAKSITSAMN